MLFFLDETYKKDQENRESLVGKKNIIIDIPFNIDLSNYMLPKSYIHAKLEKAFIRAQTKEWIEKRIRLFMKYTANSLQNQTNQDFKCLLRCTRETKQIICEELKKYDPLRENIIFTEFAEEIIEQSVTENRMLYKVCTDSDNMYQKNFIEKIHDFKENPNTKSILCQEGYIYDEINNQLAIINHPAPSFYVAIYDEDTYTALYKKRLFEKHWDVLKYPYEVIYGKNYCITIHDQNIDNSFNRIIRKYRGIRLVGRDKQQFLRQWNIVNEKDC